MAAPPGMFSRLSLEQDAAASPASSASPAAMDPSAASAPPSPLVPNPAGGTPDTAKTAPPNAFSLHIKDVQTLRAIYMPFIQGGGIFIPTTRSFDLGTEIRLILRILDQPEKHSIIGNVVWLSPAKAVGNRAQGVGVQLTKETGKQVQVKLEEVLAEAPPIHKPTQTL